MGRHLVMMLEVKKVEYMKPRDLGTVVKKS